MKFIIYFLIVFIVISCQNNPQFTQQCVKGQTIRIPVPKGKFSYYHTIALYKDSLFLGVNLQKKNTIDIYDIRNQCYCYSINVKSQYLFDRITGIQVRTMDSIYFCQGSPCCIFLINSKGDVLKTWTKEKLKITHPYYEQLRNITLNFSTFLAMHTPILCKNNMYIPFDPSQKYKTGINIERVGSYNLVKSRWNNFFANTKDLEIDIINKSLPFDLEQPYLCQKDSMLIITYPLDMTIYCYNGNSGELIYKKKYSSPYVKKLPKPVKHNKLDNCQKTWNFRVETPFFGPLFYHSEIDKFTRIYHHPQPLINSKGNINDGQERTSSIQIFDAEFNLIGESLFFNGTVGVNSYLPMKDGLLIGKQYSSEVDSILNYSEIIKIDTLIHY